MIFPLAIGLLKVDFCITCRSWKSYTLAIVLLVVSRPAISTGLMSLSEGDDDVDEDQVNWAGGWQH